MGLGDTEDRKRPTEIPALNGESCHVLEAGKFHSALLNEKNKLYMWGKNKYGQLGLGIVDQNVLEPQIVDSNSLIEEAGKHYEFNGKNLKDKICQMIILEAEWSLNCTFQKKVYNIYFYLLNLKRWI